MWQVRVLKCPVNGWQLSRRGVNCAIFEAVNVQFRPGARLACLQERTWPVAMSQNAGQFLALGELEPLARSLATVLLALFHARIASQEALGTQHRAILRGSFGKSSGNTVSDGTNLPVNATATNCGDDVEATNGVGSDKGSDDLIGEPVATTDIIFEVTAVDGHLAGARKQAHACCRILPAAGPVILDYTCHLNAFPLWSYFAFAVDVSSLSSFGC